MSAIEVGAGSAGRCRVTLWEGTTIDGPEGVHQEELSAFCEDLSYLLDSPVFFEIKYDPGSFSDPLMLWLESEFEPAVNCIFKRQLVEIERSEDGFLALTVQKQNDDRQRQAQDEGHDGN